MSVSVTLLFSFFFFFFFFPLFLFSSSLISFRFFEFHRGERKTGMATNIAHTLRSLRPEASALLMDNLGLASVGGSSQVLRRQSQQTCDAGILGHNGKCVPEATCMFVKSPSSPPMLLMMMMDGTTDCILGVMI